MRNPEGQITETETRAFRSRPSCQCRSSGCLDERRGPTSRVLRAKRRGIAAYVLLRLGGLGNEMQPVGGGNRYNLATMRAPDALLIRATRIMQDWSERRPVAE